MAVDEFQHPKIIFIAFQKQYRSRTQNSREHQIGKGQEMPQGKLAKNRITVGK